jgi:hypothetical protein
MNLYDFFYIKNNENFYLKKKIFIFLKPKFLFKKIIKQNQNINFFIFYQVVEL